MTTRHRSCPENSTKGGGLTIIRVSMEAALAKTISASMRRVVSVSIPRYWVYPDSYARYSVKTENQSSIIATSAPLPQIFSQELPTEREQISILIRLEMAMTLSRIRQINEPEDLLVVSGIVKPNTMEFQVNNERLLQVIELLPKALKQFPLYASIDLNQLVNRYWMLKKETIPHGFMRRLVSLFQVYLPAETTAVYRFTESDTFGRYVARYEIKEQGKQVQGVKRRERYVQIPTLSVQQIRIVPKGEIVFRWQESKGLTHLLGCLQTHGTVREVPLFEEQIRIEANLLETGRLSQRAVRAMKQAIEKEKYQLVSPWQNL